MKNTKSEIIRIADELIRTKGYNAFSYSDISECLKIKNASIHYYFPSKSDLGVEVIKNTILGFQNTIKSWEGMDIKTQYEKFVKMHDQTQKEHWVCLMGALSSSVDTLSDDMKRELNKMANIIIDYLTGILDKGKQQDVFSFSEDPKTKAYLIQSSLLASLLLDKVMRDGTYDIIQKGLLNS
ncbi:MAG: TetR/AcrR family transcriptional regulator [Prevotella sp.]|jgi:AcrR family transcriptional regulator|nr:TetR/AcrR family transcriptional regulator [Prevotella sp.]